MTIIVNMGKWEAIIALLAESKQLSGGELAKKLKLSRQALNRYLNGLLKDRLIYKTGSTRGARYHLAGNPPKISKKVDLRGLKEDRVFLELFERPEKWNVNTHAWEIVNFTFTEMLNNAIDHSGAKQANVTIYHDAEALSFSVIDKGIGIFSKIQKFKRLENLYEAIEELLKGKCTTDPKRHTGEGIFFTSKAADLFELESGGLKLSIDNIKKDYTVLPSAIHKGTVVFVKISLNTGKSLKKLFDTYASEFEFSKTRIYIKLYERSGTFVSRSEAKRLLLGLDKFKEIVFDFEKVESIGQGFADEIFRVFHQTHPKIKLTHKNENETVQFMIKRVYS